MHVKKWSWIGIKILHIICTTISSLIISSVLDLEMFCKYLLKSKLYQELNGTL